MPDDPSPSTSGRQRAPQACEACRATKKRCDSLLPCSHCVRRGMESSCVLATRVAPSKRRALRPSTPAWNRRLGQGQSQGLSHSPSRVSPSRLMAQSCPIQTQTQTQTQTRTQTQTQSQNKYPWASATPDDVETASIAQHPGVLLGSGEERVYVGSSAAISFLQFLRRTLRHYDGPSAFTESQKRHVMLEAEMQTTDDTFEDFLDYSSKESLATYFLEATCGFVHVFSEEHLYHLLGPTNVHSVTADGEDGVVVMPAYAQGSLVTLYAMIAIGAQCRGHGDDDLRVSHSYFSRAQELAFRDKLHKPSTSMVVDFLLLAFYMFCACRRNTALLYLGIAAKAATILGLHQPDLNKTLPPEQSELRRRAWRSLRILDLHCNAILGRPSSVPVSFTPHQEPPQRGLVHETGVSHAELSLNANYNLCSIIEAISLALTKPSSLNLEAAEGFLESLRLWAKALPEPLRESIRPLRRDQPDPGHRQRIIGNVHVACGYYFGVLLVTRPFLVAQIIPRLQTAYQGPPESQQHVLSATLDESKVQELSRTCVYAAMYLVQMCNDAASSDLLLGNMCILQAWVLAAGLVLGFSALIPSGSLQEDAQAGLTSSQKVLATLARLSPQAQRNLEILSAFSDAIASYHRKQYQGHPRPGSSYLERILRDVHPSAGEGTAGMTHTISGMHIGPQFAVSSMGGELSETFDWPEISMGTLGAEVTDEVGFQQFWDGYIAGFAAHGLSEGGALAQAPWGSVNPGIGTE